MPYQNLVDGLYLIAQKSSDKGVTHYGILDVGNLMQIPSADGRQPVVVHQTPPCLRVDWLQDTGTWNLLGKISNEQDALRRVAHAAKTPNYSLFGNNCEHFARYVATGTRESTQIQAGVIVVGLAALVIAAIRSEDA